MPPAAIALHVLEPPAVIVVGNTEQVPVGAVGTVVTVTVIVGPQLLVVSDSLMIMVPLVFIFAQKRT